MAKPTAKVVKEVCSLCGLDWKLHGKAPTSETCIGLLLAEVRSLNAQLAVRPYVSMPVYPWPRPVPWNPQPFRPYWNSTAGNSLQASSSHSFSPALSAATPRAISGAV